MSTIRNIKKEPVLLRLSSIILASSGLLLAFNYERRYLGILLFVFGFGLLVSTSINTGIEINTEKITYRKIYSFFGIIFGTWNKIPETEYLSILRTKQSRQFAGSGPHLTNTSFCIYSFAENRESIIIFQTDDKSEAFEIAMQIASILKISILDATEKEQNWLT